MKQWVIGLLAGICMLSAPSLSAQAPSREVVLSAQAGSKLALAVPFPQLGFLDEALVRREFHEVLLRDLAEAGPFSLVKGSQPKGADISAHKAWMEVGADWLVAVRVQRSDDAKSDEALLLVTVSDVRSGKSVFNKRYLGRSTVLRRMAHSVADDLNARLTGEKGISNTRIVFVRQTSPLIKEIFQVDRDGHATTQITHHHSLTLSPTMANDGRLAYMTYKGGPPELWGQRRVGGPIEKLLPTKTSPQGPCMSPAWSPDGRRLAFVQGDKRGNTDIMVMDIASGRVRRLTDSNCINTEPTWNPKGTQLAFTSDREGTPQIYLMEDDGSNVRRLTREGSYNASPSWSPNGSMIAYVSRFEGKFDLFVFKLGEGRSYQVTTGVASSESPDWSPDERRLVFSSGSRGGMQLYTVDLAGNDLRRLTDYSGCQSPKWTRSR